MNYYLQDLDVSNLQWSRLEDDEGYDMALEGLEARDEIKSDWGNDGITRGCRLVDDDGT